MSDTPKPYEPPVVRELGTVHELTLKFNKVGQQTDGFTALTGGAVTGDLVMVS